MRVVALSILILAVGLFSVNAMVAIVDGVTWRLLAQIAILPIAVLAVRKRRTRYGIFAFWFVAGGLAGWSDILREHRQFSWPPAILFSVYLIIGYVFRYGALRIPAAEVVAENS